MKSLILKGILQTWTRKPISLQACLYSSTVTNKDLLSKLRKQTGIPFIKCRAALEKFDNNFSQAKSWLLEQAQKEGWEKATKLQSRPMSQGVIAVLRSHMQATMVEVNCETDFVARNDKFLDLVKTVAEECDAYCSSHTQNQIILNNKELENVRTRNEKTLSDLVALSIAGLGENLAVRRAAFYRSSPNTFISSYVHPSSSMDPNQKLWTGQYGTIVELDKLESNDSSSEDMAQHLCQHIIGMNPKVIGEPPIEGNLGVESKRLENQDKEETKIDDKEKDNEIDDEMEFASNEPELVVGEDQLLRQTFLLDPSLTVSKVLETSGLKVCHFLRFNCGEELDEDAS